ncbi:hypothetical protein MCGFDL_MCGFDL_09450, partial [Dysosmobacter welbionis]
RHQAGNVVEADPARQEQAHRLLIGAVQNSAGGAALSRRRLCQLQTWKCIPVRLGEGQGRAGQQVQRLRRTFHPFGVCHGISNGQAHIRCAQLGQDRPVPVLHQGVDDALPVDHHRHLVQRQTVEAHGLDDLQPLVHQRGAVYGDLGSHGPVGVAEGIRFGHFAHFFIGHAVKRPAGTGQDQPPDLPAVGAALKALEDGRVLRVHRHDLGAVR